MRQGKVKHAATGKSQNASTEVGIDLLASLKVFADESRAMLRRRCILFTKAIALCQRVANAGE